MTGKAVFHRKPSRLFVDWIKSTRNLFVILISLAPKRKPTQNRINEKCSHDSNNLLFNQILPNICTFVRDATSKLLPTFWPKMTLSETYSCYFNTSHLELSSESKLFLQKIVTLHIERQYVYTDVNSPHGANSFLLRQSKQ